MVLAGGTNKDIVARINQHGGEAVGLCGIDAGLLRVEKATDNGTELGLVGTVTDVNVAFLSMLLEHNTMPVIAPVGVDRTWKAYNVNADLAAASVAAALKAEKLVYLSDVEGVLVNGALVKSLKKNDARQLIDSGVIINGMVPKIRSAFDALEDGVEKVHMIDGRVKHSLLLEIFTDEGVGTELLRSISRPVSEVPAQ